MKQSIKWRAPLACILALASTSVFAEGDVAAGEAKAATCLGCHGIPGYQNVYPSYHVPRIGGQHAAYIVEALKAYKQGNRSHKTMIAQAASLSDQDMQDLAVYFASLGAAPGPK
jgi:cytochrome c553